MGFQFQLYCTFRYYNVVLHFPLGYCCSAGLPIFTEVCADAVLNASNSNSAATGIACDGTMWT
jgi:hypothetical protein